MDEQAIQRLIALRQRLFDAIGRQLARCGDCKIYEGRFAINLPNYFERHDENNAWRVELDCYVIGPSRHYEWRGDTLAEAVEKAERDVSKWIIERDEDSEDSE